MPEVVKTWFNRARLVTSIVAVGQLMAGLLSLLLLVLLVLGVPEDSSEPWSVRDIWLTYILFAWLVILPALLLIFLGLGEKKRRYLYACTMLLALAATAQFAFLLHILLFFSPSLQFVGLASLCFVCWLVALYLMGIVWSKIKLTKRLAS